MKTMKIMLVAALVALTTGCSIAPNKVINGEVVKVNKLTMSIEKTDQAATVGVDWAWMVANYDIVTVKHINDWALGAGGNAYAEKKLGVKVGDYVQLTNGDMDNKEKPVAERIPHIIVVKKREDCKWDGPVLLKQTLACKGDSEQVWK